MKLGWVIRGQSVVSRRSFADLDRAGRGRRAKAHEHISTSDVDASLTATVYRLSATRLCQTSADGGEGGPKDHRRHLVT